ncbi:MAG: hypothetical protein LWW83_07265 [Azonexaceae bacterium]|uniref:cation efflux protein, CzcI family n=1 Tax=Azonexus sp. R2A61 TaxID=2744443 RepID=UPI001F2DE9A2|nr:cation efflux protein, CzcI family [Azonexus sp. R2A61]MCE1239696.1 hypothetical protein [Azonexaceae bacterium]
MRRWVSIFLLIILPLQVSWAAAAVYCQHEAGTGQHFGHHDHKHQAGDGESSGKSPSLSVDNDCAVCHAGCVAALTAVGCALPRVEAIDASTLLVRFLASPPGEEPERPNWLISA